MAAASDMFHIPRDEHLKNVRPARMSGIRELYHMLTGDYGMRGGYYPDEVGLATTLDFTGLVKTRSINWSCRAGIKWESPGILVGERCCHRTVHSLQEITGRFDWHDCQHADRRRG